MARVSTTVETVVLPKSIREIRQWKDGTPQPQDDFLVNGIFLNVLIKEMDELRSRVATLESQKKH